MDARRWSRDQHKDPDLPEACLGPGLEEEEGFRVSNASVIGRIWGDMSEFQADVLVAAVSDENEQEIAEMLTAVEPVFRSADRSSIEGRQWALGELTRVAGDTHFDSLARSRTWQLFVGIWGLAVSRAESAHSAAVTSAAAITYERNTQHFEEIFAAAFSFMGFRIHEGYTLRQLILAVNSLSEGCALRDRIDPVSMRGILRPTGPHGEDQEWTLFSVCVEALIRQFTELDPDFDPTNLELEITSVVPNEPRVGIP